MNESRMLTDEETRYVLSITDEQVTKANMIKWFAIQKQTKPMFSPQDKFKLPKGKLHNDTDIITTVGRYVFNVFIVKPFKGTIKYINEPITKGRLEDVEAQIAQMVLDETVPNAWFIDYLNRIQWFGYVGVDFLTPGMSLGVILPNKTVQARKKELLEEHKEELAKGNAIIAGQVEKELVNLAKDVLKDDPAIDLYNSGAKSKFATHYKAFNIMKGPVKDNSQADKYNVCTSDYMDGVDLKEYHNFGDTIVYAAYSRAVGTQKGGYITKQMFAAFQSVTLDAKGTDCGCKKTLDILLTKKNHKLFLYRYIVEGGKLVRLDNTNIKSYIGKTVKFRSALFCQSPKLCNKCSGDLYYNLGIENIGLTVTKVGSTVLNLSLKNFHDTTIHLKRINFKDYID